MKLIHPWNQNQIQHKRRAVFGATLMLCPTCVEVHLCAACKSQHIFEDNNGKVGISVDNQFTVTNVAPGSPADLAGIKIGDTIQSIDGVSTSDELVPSIKGKVGSHVTLTLCRPSTTNFTVTIIHGSEPKGKRTALEPMPGIRVLGLVSNGKHGYIYEVERDFSLAGEKIGVPKRAYQDQKGTFDLQEQQNGFWAGTQFTCFTSAEVQILT